MPLKVQPRIRLRRPSARGVVRAPVPVRGGVAPRKRTLYLVLQIRKGGRFKRIGIDFVPARRGRFTTLFRPQRRGTYRFYVSSRGDRLNAGGRSLPQVVQVR